MTEPKVKIELEEWEAELFVKFRKYLLQFQKLQGQNIFEKDFTGRVVLDILDGSVKNLQKIINFHFQIKI